MAGKTKRTTLTGIRRRGSNTKTKTTQILIETAPENLVEAPPTPLMTTRAKKRRQPTDETLTTTHEWNNLEPEQHEIEPSSATPDTKEDDCTAEDRAYARLKMELLRQKLRKRLLKTKKSQCRFPTKDVVKIVRAAQAQDLSLPQFNGDVISWPTFIKKYHKTTTRYSIDEDANRERLMKALKGPALRLVQSKLRSTCLLQTVLKELEVEYGGKQNIIKAVISKAKKLRPLHQKLQNIDTFVIEILQIQRMFHICSDPGMETLLLTLIVEELPQKALTKWGDYQREIGKSKTGNFDEFVDFSLRLEERYTTKNSRSRSRSKSQSPERRRDRSDSRNRSTTRRDDARRDRSRSPRSDYRYTNNTQTYRSYGREREERVYRPHNNAQTPPRILLAQASHTNAPLQNTIRRNPVSPETAPTLCVLGCSDAHLVKNCRRYTEAGLNEQFELRNKHRLCHSCCGQHMWRDCPEKRQTN